MDMIRLIRTDDFTDLQSIQDVTQQVRCLEVDDFQSFMDCLPSVTELIKALPRSLPLLDAIYTKCEKLRNYPSNVFRKYLQCEQLLNRILWWLAQLQQGNTGDKKAPLQMMNTLQFPVVKNHIRSILAIIQRETPEVIEEMLAEKAQLMESLEALGCHCLVNTNSGVIRLIDATLFETYILQDRLTKIIHQLKEIQKQKMSFLDESPSKSSHQRQLNLKLSEVFDRLRQNEMIEEVLADILSNQNLMSLHRIVSKRIRADRAIINIFNSYKNTKPDGFQIFDLNPIVAKFIVIFKNAYSQLTELVPTNDEADSGYHHGDDEFSHKEQDLTSDLSSTSPSLGNRIIDNVGKNSPKVKNDHHFPRDARWITLSIYSSPSEVQALVERFSELYTVQKMEVLRSLDELKEFKGLKELQLKTMFSAVVLTYQLVYEATQQQYSNVYSVLECKDDDVIMDFSIYRLLYRQAKSDGGLSNARDVTTKIWNALYDFPSLKMCTRFNRFILDCVSIIWDIVAGIDGRLPRIKMDYEGKYFDSKKHTKDPSSTTSIVIKQFLWPGLVIENDENRLLKAVIVTG
uniref:Mitochondria-eating protein n=1 Tax=Panagrolaimus sp. JU765 TaxID=591449 RepID=A0AC34QHA7_9BILA